MNGDDACARAVDIHVHAVPPALIDRAESGSFPSVGVVSRGGAPVLSFPDADAAPPVPAAMSSPRALADAASSQHVGTQLLSPWTDLFGYTLPEGEAAEWSRAYNVELARLCDPSPHHVPLATIPLSHPRDAVSELAHARELGCPGVIVGTDIPGMNLGSPELEPVWEAAAALAMPVLVHPTHLRIPPELKEAGLRNAVGRAHPTALALTQMLYSGALNRHAALTVIACHGGGALATVLPRVLRNHELGWSGSDVDVRAGVARVHFDTVVLDSDLLRYLIRTFGADRFLLGSDLPFAWEPDALGTVVAALPAGSERDGVLRANAERLYRLADGPACTRCSASPPDAGSPASPSGAA